VKTSYELRICGSGGASAEIVEVKDGIYTTRARATIQANKTTTVLRWEPLKVKETQMNKSLAKRLRPNRMNVNLGFLGFEWNLKK